jgi:crotonobetainyl-CoA:carnitine CoA-transferase CaiB-like acyl-CoA transferase
MPAPDLSRGALTGLRVIDLSRVLAGPLCTQMLADHGADVVKIEPPSGDETRLLGPPFDEAGDAAYFGAVNRGKRALGLDLARPEGRAVLEALLKDADILVENYLPGTMERWNLGYDEVLSVRHPRLVYCAISGFGADGPLGGLPGYDAVLQAMSGLMSINGTPESGPTRVGVPIVDYVTGYNALTGILLALAARQQTGRGQKVEVTLFDTALSLLVPHAANWLCSGRTPGRLGSAHPNIAPYDKFAAGDGELFLGIVNDGQFRRFCRQVKREDLLQDPRFGTNAARLENAAALRSEIERTLASFKVEDLCHAKRRARGRREHRAAGFRAGACRPSADADRPGRTSRTRHPREARRNAGPAGPAAAALRRARPRDPGRGRVRSGRCRPPAGVRRSQDNQPIMKERKR